MPTIQKILRIISLNHHPINFIFFSNFKKIDGTVFSASEEIFKTDYIMTTIQQAFREMKPDKIFTTSDKCLGTAGVVFNLPTFV
jgi:hypothetical protein